MRRLLALAAGAVLALAGCGVGAGPEQPGGAELRVTRDFGQAPLHRGGLERIREGQTVMDLLQRERRVETAYGGAFVQSIDGLEGEGATGRRDWFYFVNGIEASTGAAERRLAPGDVVQWDYRRWDGAMSVPAVVGAYPEPLASESGAPRRAVRLECEDAGGGACGEARRRLSAAGAQVAEAAPGAPGAPAGPRVVVARWSRARTLPDAERLEAAPEESGVFARFADSGRRLDLLDADGRRVRAAAPGSGLVAALGAHGEEPTWFVTGVDEAGVAAAARALDRAVLGDRYAVAVEPGGPIALPVGARSVSG